MIPICKNCGAQYTNYSDPGEVPVMVHPSNNCKNGEPIEDTSGISEALHNAWLQGFESGRNKGINSEYENDPNKLNLNQ